MRTNNRILKIHSVTYPEITFISNAGEYRDLNVKKHFKKAGIKKGDWGYEIVDDKALFSRVTLVDNALAWQDVVREIELSDGTNFRTFFHLDPILSIKNSEINLDLNSLKSLRKKLKSLRKRLQLTQEELGKRIGSNKQYISRVENSDTDLELKTLRKIFELGFDEKLFISHYKEDDVLTSFSNSILKDKFILWANARKDELTLIEGIGEKTKTVFHKVNIFTPATLAQTSYSYIWEILSHHKPPGFYHCPESWSLQAKYIANNDWFGLVNFQRNISDDPQSSYSKIEQMAKREIGEDIFLVG